MLTARPIPVARPPAHQDLDNDLLDERPMDKDDCLDYADQEPLPFPASTGELGPMAQFLSEMPYVIEGIEKVCRGPLIHFLFLHQAHTASSTT
jgi:hypothetical protein